MGTSALTDRQALQQVLVDRSSRYLARQLCWILTVRGVETYLLQPRESLDLELLIEALRPKPSALDVDVVIGTLGPVAPPNLCNGLALHLLTFDQIYSFDRDALISSVPYDSAEPETSEDQFRSTVGEVFDLVMLMTDNDGISDKHRALNYLVLRYPAIYSRAAKQQQHNSSLTAIHAAPSSLGGDRRIVDVVFAYRNRSTDFVEKFAVSVDVTEEFPFLVSSLHPYIDR
jgi:hypothetical protein